LLLILLLDPLELTLPCLSYVGQWGLGGHGVWSGKRGKLNILFQINISNKRNRFHPTKCHSCGITHMRLESSVRIVRIIGVEGVIFDPGIFLPTSTHQTVATNIGTGVTISTRHTSTGGRYTTGGTSSFTIGSLVLEVTDGFVDNFVVTRSIDVSVRTCIWRRKFEI